MRRLFVGVLVLLLGSVSVSAQVGLAGPARVDGSYFNGLSWRLIGPFRGGRVIAVSGVPGEPEHFYFGAVDGGVWETTNAGRTWNPIFDSETSPSIGAIAVAPSDVHTIYVGTGEADMRSNIAYGNGVWKSTDAGKTWSHIGLDDTRQIGKIVVDPKDANVVYVAALGHQYGPNAERGVFKTIDGGKSWSKVLFKNNDTGAIDLAMNPQDPNVVYASLWQTRRPPWNTYPPSYGPGSGLYKTSDGGKTWVQLKAGLPSRVGHIGLATTPANPSRVYAQVDAVDVVAGGVYRSDDNGVTWTHLAGGENQQRIWKRGWYFGGITADPKNADVVYLMNTATYRSADGGRTFDAFKGSPGGDDYHVMWIDPANSNRLELAGDQGSVISVDGGKSWSSWYNQPTAQFYHVATDDRFPYWVYGAQQDSGAMAVPSQTMHDHISMRDWRPMDVGGESGTIAPNPGHPAKLFGSFGTYEDLDTGWEQTNDATLKYPDQVWRQTWTLPIVVSPADKKTLYTSHQRVFRSNDGGHSWSIISPDLTRMSDENHPANLDQATLEDSSGLPHRGVVYWLAPSALDAKLLWAGTDDGYVWITRDGGRRWTNVTPKELGPWSKVGIIDASHFDRQSAYIAVDRHRLDDVKPNLYRTHDGGASWTPIANGIPEGAFVNVVRADPKTPGLLYAGTERGVYISFNDGDSWQSLQRNLPITSARDIDVHGDDLVIATHGRGFWIMDDIVPLRQMASAVTARRAYLFAPATTYRVRRSGGVGGGIADEGTPLQPDEPQANNPPVGAYIDYMLHGTPSTPVTLEIINAKGTVLRKWSSDDKLAITDPSTVDIAPRWIPTPAQLSADPGAHRFVWGFQEHADDGTLVPPGRYAVRLSANGVTQARTLEIRRDPRLLTTDADLHAQYELATSINAKIAQVKTAKDRAKELLKSSSLSAAQKAALQNDIIGAPPQPNFGSSPNKPPQDFYSLRYLGDAYGNLWGAVEGADAPPTADMRAAFSKLNGMLATTLAKLRRL